MESKENPGQLAKYSSLLDRLYEEKRIETHLRYLTKKYDPKEITKHHFQQKRWYEVYDLLDEYDEGEYVLDGVTMKNLSQTQAAQYRNQFLGFVFQSFNLLPFKSAKENVALPLYYKKVPRKERTKLAVEYLEKVGLKDWADHLPNQMSGGQQQRVAIARALISQPKVILADEPTGALDTQTSHDVMEIFKQVNQQGITVIIVTHEEDIAEMTNRIIRLKDGNIETG